MQRLVTIGRFYTNISIISIYLHLITSTILILIFSPLYKCFLPHTPHQSFSVLGTFCYTESINIGLMHRSNFLDIFKCSQNICFCGGIYGHCAIQDNLKWTCISPTIGLDTSESVNISTMCYSSPMQIPTI